MGKRKFYKIVNPSGNKGGVYKEGLNIYQGTFSKNNFYECGLFFTTKGSLRHMLSSGSELYEVEPIGEYFKVGNEFKATALVLKKIGSLGEVKTFRFIIGRDKDYDSLLTDAAKYGYKKVVKYLIKKGANVHYLNGLALCLAINGGHLESVKALVRNGARDELGIGLFGTAALCGHLEIVKYIVGLGGIKKNWLNWAFFSAVLYGHLDIIKFLLERGVDIRMVGKSAIALAKPNGHKEVVEYLESLNK